MAITSLFRKKNRIVLAKLETTYGVDAVPTVADNAIEAVDDISMNTPFEVIETNKLSSDKSKSKPITGKVSSEINFSLYLTGSGTRGTAGRDAPLWKACGEDVAASAGVKVTHHPTNTNYSCTIYVYDVNPNGNYLLRKFVGCVGNVVREGRAGQLATAKFSFKGLYTKPSDVSNPGTPVYDSVDPITVESASLQFGAETGLVVESFSLDNGNEITERNSISAENSIEGFAITAFGPKVTINPEQTLIGELDLYGICKAKTESLLKIDFGSLSGNEVMISGAKCVINTINVIDRNGLSALELALSLNKTNGDDQFHQVVT